MSLSTESPHAISAMISSAMAWLPSHKGSQAPQSMACATICNIYIYILYHNIYKYFQYKHVAIVYLHVLSRPKDHDPNIIKKMKVDNVTLSSLVILDSKFLATPLVSWVHGTGCPRLQCRVFQVLLPIFSSGTSISSYLNSICLVFHASSIIFNHLHTSTCLYSVPLALEPSNLLHQAAARSRPATEIIASCWRLTPSHKEHHGASINIPTCRLGDPSILASKQRWYDLLLGPT